LRTPALAAAVVLAALAAAVAGAAAHSPAPDVSGFLLDRGRYTTIPATRAGEKPSPIGINERGQIVGSYADSRGMTHGFLLEKNGSFTRIDVPGATGTQAEKINNRGQVVGVYVETPDPAPSAPRRGFLLDQGRFTRLDAPGAVSTLAHGINDRGQVVGEYKDAGGRFHGFLWDKGRFTTFDGPDGTGASFTEINDRGQIIGVYGRSRSLAPCRRR
jgi:probable HAF family extracellular repeat protein